MAAPDTAAQGQQVDADKRTPEARLDRLERDKLALARLLYAISLMAKEHFEKNYGFKPPITN